MTREDWFEQQKANAMSMAAALQRQEAATRQPAAVEGVCSISKRIAASKSQEASKFSLNPGTAGSIAGRLVATLEDQTGLPVDPFIRTELIRRVMAPLMKLEIQGKQWACPEITRQKLAAAEHYHTHIKSRIDTPARRFWKGSRTSGEGVA